MAGSLPRPGASKGTPGDAKCVTEILGGGGVKIRKLGQSLKFGQLILIVCLITLCCTVAQLNIQVSQGSAERDLTLCTVVWSGA